MSSPNLLTDSRRVAELRSLSILDTPAEPDYDDLAVLARIVSRSPVAAVNFVDGERHFTKAIAGVPDAQGDCVANDLSFCAATIGTADGVLVISDTGTDDDGRWRTHPLVAGGPRVGSYAGASIVSGGQRVGVICAFGPEPREIGADQRSALVALARQASAHLSLRRRNAELRDLAVTDALTGLANRTLLYDRLALALADRGRIGGHVGVLFCDVDDFKHVNDRYGHQVGDRLLRDIAEHLSAVARDTDTVARIAGDEFVVVCPRLTGEADLEALIGRVMDERDERRRMPDGTSPPRLSVGAVIARDGELPSDVLRNADAAMYAAKALAKRPTD